MNQQSVDNLTTIVSDIFISLVIMSLASVWHKLQHSTRMNYGIFKVDFFITVLF